MALATSHFDFLGLSVFRDLRISLHDALPIFVLLREELARDRLRGADLNHPVALQAGRRRDQLADDHVLLQPEQAVEDRKSTRLNSSHVAISYAVFCLKKKTTPLPPCRPAH